VASKTPDSSAIVTDGDLGANAAAFLRSLRADSSVSPNTIATYGGAVRLFADFLTEHGYPTNVAEITRELIEEWQLELTDGTATRQPYAPASVHNRLRGLQRFLSYLVERERLDKAPRIKLPKLDDSNMRVLREDQLLAVLSATKGKRFEDVRDRALIRLLLDTGARRAEITNLRWTPDDETTNDIDLDRGTMRVARQKGGGEITIGLGRKTLAALDDYIIDARSKHPYAHLPWLWLSRRGRLTDSGVFQVVRERGNMAGIAQLHPHDFRHADSHYALLSGMSETDLMRKRGWRSPAMLRRYAQSTGQDRAIIAAKKHSLGDRI
jgi:integrase/recombinase XerC